VLSITHCKVFSLLFVLVLSHSIMFFFLFNILNISLLVYSSAFVLWRVIYVFYGRISFLFLFVGSVRAGVIWGFVFVLFFWLLWMMRRPFPLTSILFILFHFYFSLICFYFLLNE